MNAVCPHCETVHTPDDTDELLVVPCQGCEEFDTKLEQIAEADNYEETE